MRLFIANLILLIPFGVFANKLTVTTNASSGTGSLREAITLANLSVTSADTIIFNITDQSEAGRTISLNAELPYIYSNLTIDGTTQPGSPFGTSKTKIKVQPGIGFPTFGTIFFIWENLAGRDASNVSIYGMFIYDSFTPGLFSRIGIRAIQSLNLKLGGVDKGNVISGFSNGIFLSTASNRNALIEYNWIGLNPFGTCASVAETNGISIMFTLVADVIIQKNYIFSFSHSVDYSIVPVYTRTASILDNFFGTDVTGEILTLSNVSVDKKIINIYYSGMPFTPVTGQVYEFKIKKNVIAGKANAGVVINQTVYYYVVIDSNTIGTNSQLIDPAGISITNGILFSGSYPGTSRMPTFSFANNKIFYCAYGISRSTFSKVWITNNSFFCNQVGITTSPPITGLNLVITGVTENTVSGTTEYGSGVIEIYSMKDCGASGCQGFKKLASINPTSANWSYCGYLEGRIVATQFTGDGTTSDFSNCLLSPNNPVITNASCTSDAGSITGVSVPANGQLTWRNSSGSIVGSNNDLLNVPAGKYYYKVVSNNCSYTSDTFEIKSLASTFIDTTLVDVQNDLCNGTGSIENIKVLGGTTVKWIDSSENIVSTNVNLLNRLPGRYRLVVSNSGCIYQTQWYIIKSFYPKIDTAKIIVTNTTCNRNNGAISYTGTLNSTYSFSWTNAQNIIVANNQNTIPNLAAGNYFFNLTRDSTEVSCSKQYGPFLIAAEATPSINTSTILLTDASCGNSNGSIKNIQVTNAQTNPTYRWEDSLGVVVGNSLNLLNVNSGTFRLKVKDGGSCDTMTTSFFILKNNGIIVIDTTAMTIKPAGCNLSNGSITGIKVTGATSYVWTDVSTSTSVNMSLVLENISQGYYKLTASNSHGCEASIQPKYVSTMSFLPVSVTSHKYRNANCGFDNGSINSIQLSHNSFYGFHWIDSISGLKISNNLSVSNLPASTYLLYATDTNNCEEKILSKSISQLGKPQINDTALKIVNDLCNLKQGGISGLQVNGGAGAPYDWKMAG